MGLVICEDPLCRRCRPCVTRRRFPPTDVVGICPFVFEREMCWQASQQVDPTAPSGECREARRRALNACEEYRRKVMSLPPEMRALCPYAPDIPECAPQCCIRIICRDMASDRDTVVPGIDHCAVEKVGCDGGRVLWESTPTTAADGNESYAPVFSPVTPAIRRTTSRMYQSANREDDWDARNVGWVVAEMCQDCTGSENGWAEPSPCSDLNDEWVRQYPGGEQWGIGIAGFAPSCNSFAAYAEAEFMGTSHTCSSWQNWGSGYWSPPPPDPSLLYFP